MNQIPGGGNSGFNPIPHSLSQRFGLQLGHAGLNETVSRGLDNSGFNQGPRFGGQSSGRAQSGFGDQSYGVSNAGFNTPPRFGTHNYGVVNAGVNYPGPQFRFPIAGREQSIRGPEEQATPPKIPRFGNMNTPMRPDNTGGIRPGTNNISHRPWFDNNRGPRPLINHIGGHESWRETATGQPRIQSENTLKTGSGRKPEQLLSQFFNPHPSGLIGKQTVSGNTGENKSRLEARKDNTSQWEASFSNRNVENTKMETGSRSEPVPLMSLSLKGNKAAPEESRKSVTGVPSSAEGTANRTEPLPLLSISFNPHPSALGVRQPEKSVQPKQSMQWVRSSESQLKTVKPRSEMESAKVEVVQKSKHPSGPVPLMSLSQKRNRSLLDVTGKDQGSDLEEDEEQVDIQEATSSDGDGDWEDEGTPSVTSFNPLPSMLVTKTSMPKEIDMKFSEKEEMYNSLSSFIKGEDLFGEGTDNIEKGDTKKPVLSGDKEKPFQSSLLKVERYPPLPMDNIGHLLLERMGWTPGTGLGVSRSGIKRPVTAGGRSGGRHGLGGVPQKKKKEKNTEFAPFAKITTQHGIDSLTRFVEELVKHLYNGTKTPCCVLNEYCLKRQRRVVYRIVKTNYDTMFARKCFIAGKFYEVGTGTSKKVAKFAAATNAFNMLIRELYHGNGMRLPEEVEMQLSKGSETFLPQRPKALLPEWEQSWSGPRPTAQTGKVTPELEYVVQKFCEGFKPASNAIAEYCMKQNMKVEFKEVDEERKFGYRCYIDEVEYELGVGQNKKTAKADASNKAFIAFVRELYKNSDIPLPDQFVTMFKQDLTRLEEQEATAKQQSQKNWQPVKPRLKWDQTFNPRTESGQNFQSIGERPQRHASTRAINYGQDEWSKSQLHSMNYGQTEEIFKPRIPRPAPAANMGNSGQNEQTSFQRTPVNFSQNLRAQNPRLQRPASVTSVVNFGQNEQKSFQGPSLNFIQNIHSQNPRLKRPASTSNINEQTVNLRFQRPPPPAAVNSSQNVWSGNPGLPRAHQNQSSLASRLQRLAAGNGHN